MANPAPGFVKNPTHTITLDKGPDVVTVLLDGKMVAATTHAVILHEDGYKQRAYIPREEVIGTLSKNSRSTHCPYKGDAAYFDLTLGETRVPDAAWSYEAPFDEMAAIEGHISFDDRFELRIG